MMFCSIHLFALWIFVISATSAQLRPSKSGRSDGTGTGNGFQSAFLCSEAGNCTCFFEEFRVTVKCTSAGDKLDRIAFQLPRTTTHLILRNNGISNLLPLIGLIKYFKDLKVLDLRDNHITTPGSIQVERVLGRLSKVLLDNNPLECNCGITPSLWTAVTGTCAHPPHLRGVELGTLHIKDFKCAPSRAPDLVTAHSSSSTSLVVKWRHLPEEHFQGQPIGYNITYYPVDLESDINFKSVNYTTNTTILTDLTIYTMYIINVSAVSSGGIGPENQTMARTDAAAPSRAPGFVTARRSSSISLVVKWGQLPEEHFQGQPIGYNITYYPVDLESDVNFVNLKYTRNTTTLTDLTVYTMHVINVLAVSSGGTGPAITAN